MTPDAEPNLGGLLEFAVDAAWRSGVSTLGHFQSTLPVEWKADESPVTAADRGAESLLRERIRERFPDHAVVGEEWGDDGRVSRFRWILDPIDGTQSFIRGVPLYGVLVALEIDGQVSVGVAAFPALREIVAAARGLGCWWNGRRARVSTVSRLNEAVVVYSDARDLARRRPSEWSRVQDATRVQRGWGDCYGHCLVATGRADIALDPVMNLWDCAALLPILQEAGGTFTSWSGETTVTAPEAVSTNGALFSPLMQLIRS